MIAFKILLIILISAPTVGLGWFLFAQVDSYARRKNAAERGRSADHGRRRR